MAESQVNLFPEIAWSLLNFVLLLAIPACVIVYVVRLNRRVKRIEERLNLQDQDMEK